jgi:hypothetical protein
MECDRHHRLDAVERLSAFIRLDNSSKKLQTYHKSFDDFLTTYSSESHFFVNLKEEHVFVADRCLKVAKDSGILDTMGDGQVQEDSKMLKYVLVHGITHLSFAGRPKEAQKLSRNKNWQKATIGAMAEQSAQEIVSSKNGRPVNKTD